MPNVACPSPSARRMPHLAMLVRKLLPALEPDEPEMAPPVSGSAKRT